MSGKYMAPLFGPESLIVETFQNRPLAFPRGPEAFLDALDDLIVDDILSMSGDELRAEIIGEGGDPDAMEAECRAGLERAIRECQAARPGRGRVSDVPMDRDRDVLHENRLHYVVQTRSTRPGGPDLFCVRRQGPVLDKTLARISGPSAREQAVAMVDALAEA